MSKTLATARSPSARNTKMIVAGDLWSMLQKKVKKSPRAVPDRARIHSLCTLSLYRDTSSHNVLLRVTL